jgi:beta-barrel assembly-enhancing protease
VRVLVYLLLIVSSAAFGKPDVDAYRALAEQDLRLATVGYKLASANAQFCQRKTRNPAMVLHDVAQYPDMKTAFAAFAFPEPIAVAAVVTGGPADMAGVKAGDGLAAIGDESMDLSDEVEQGPTSKRITDAKKRLALALVQAGSVQLQLVRGISPKIVKLNPPLVCASEFWVDTRSTLDAGADGDGVRITEGFMIFTSNDDAELAAVVAHELAHNLLGHRQQLKSNGGTKSVLATEIEADRLSVWLMANAGYEPKAALRFTERHGRKYGLGIFSDGTHLRWKNRNKVMQAEIGLMANTRKQAGLLPPPLLVGG